MDFVASQVSGVRVASEERHSTHALVRGTCPFLNLPLFNEVRAR